MNCQPAELHRASTYVVRRRLHICKKWWNSFSVFNFFAVTVSHRKWFITRSWQSVSAKTRFIGKRVFTLLYLRIQTWSTRAGVKCYFHLPPDGPITHGAFPSDICTAEMKNQLDTLRWTLGWCICVHLFWLDINLLGVQGWQIDCNMFDV
jgi:hypothetical protein